MRGNINFILDIIDDNQVADKILVDFFNVKIKSDNLSFKKIQLKSFLLESNTKQVTKKYRKKAKTPLDIVLIECAIGELKNKTKEELLLYFSTKEGINIPNFYKVCTIMYTSSDFIKDNIEILSKNIKENRLLFSGIYDEFINEENDTKIVNHIKQLDELIMELRKNINELSSSNKKLSNDNQKLDNEIVKLKREFIKNENRFKLYENKISNCTKENETLKEEILKLRKLNKEKEEDNKLLNNEIIKFKNINIELKKELKENELNIELDGFEPDYKLAFIHQNDFKVCKKIFNEVLFINYEDITNKYYSFIQILKKYNINNVIMQINKISTFDIMKLENNLRKENVCMDIEILNNEKSAIKFITKNLHR